MMDEQTLREIYARHFEMVIRGRRRLLVMAAYNLVNGKKATAEPAPADDILRDDFGFKGFVLSDWWAMPNGCNRRPIPSRRSGRRASRRCRPGMDMELPWALNYGQLEPLVANGQLTDERAHHRRPRASWSRSSASTPTSVGPLGQAPFSGYDGTPSHEVQEATPRSAQRATSRSPSRPRVESMVLLKNDNNTLPIKPSVTKDRRASARRRSRSATQNRTARSSNGRAASSTSRPTSAPATSGSSRVFHDPAQGVGPFAGIKDGARGSGDRHVTPLATPPARSCRAPTPISSSWSPA